MTNRFIIILPPKTQICWNLYHAIIHRGKTEAIQIKKVHGGKARQEDNGKTEVIYIKTVTEGAGGSATIQGGSTEAIKIKVAELGRISDYTDWKGKGYTDLDGTEGGEPAQIQ